MIGIAELNRNAGRVIRDLDAGPVLITDHGRVVAKLSKAGGANGIERLIEHGRVTPGGGGALPVLGLALPKGTGTADLLAETRGER